MRKEYGGKGEKGINVRKFIYQMKRLYVELLMGYLKNQFSTSQETLRLRYKPNRLMLFRETVAVYCKNHTEHTNTLCGQNI
jgi:hypothetical protein